MKEYRICWLASTNCSFEGHSDWIEWDKNDNATEEEIIENLTGVTSEICEGLTIALDESGFFYWIEFKNKISNK